MKCRYKYCKFGGEVSKEEAVKNGNAYYHPQCMKEQEDKAEIRKLLYEINQNEIISVVNSVIFDIIHRKQVDSAFVLFVLKNRDFEIYNSKGLYPLINSKKLQDKYKKIQDSKIKVDTKVIEAKPDTTFQPKTKKGKLWGDILFPQDQNH